VVDLKEKVRLGTRMLGRAIEAAQIERQFSLVVPVAAKKLTSAKQNVK